VLRLLLARGAPMDAACLTTGGTALHYACLNNYPDCVEALRPRAVPSLSCPCY
jgi:ankyrin repeat protein